MQTEAVDDAAPPSGPTPHRETSVKAVEMASSPRSGKNFPWLRISYEGLASKELIVA